MQKNVDSNSSKTLRETVIGKNRNLFIMLFKINIVHSNIINKKSVLNMP